jgi:nucleoside-diphosphate-sugar epimerase
MSERERGERVLVTGAFGNIGRNAVPALVEAGYRVRALRFERAEDRAVRRAFGPTVEVIRGDVRDRAAMDAAVRDVDVVVHLAYLIPPPALEQPDLARSVNLDGTRTLLAACGAAARPPRFLFASTLDVYGLTAHLPPPRRVGDPVSAADAYGQHKIDCEGLVAGSGLAHAILRFADVPPIAVRAPHPMMFRVPLAQRIETLHPADAGLAVARAVATPAAWGRTLNIGGGPACQLVYRDYLGAFLDAMGVGPLPDEAFCTDPYCTDWLDTEESQRLLGYQTRTFADVVRETAALLGWQRPLARLLGPVLRTALLQVSPWWRSRGWRARLRSSGAPPPV